MKRLLYFLLMFTVAILSYQCKGQTKTSDEQYTYKSGSFDGIGKWYQGREIAHVMGFQGISWLERPEREKEENTSKLIQNLRIKPNDTIADIGAGSGYHVFKMAMLTKQGIVYAVDIQEEMLEEMRTQKREIDTENVELVKGTEKSVNLRENSVDKILW